MSQTEDKLILWHDSLMKTGDTAPIPRQLHDILPYMNPRQQQAYLFAREIAERHQLTSVLSQMDKFMLIQRENRPLPFSFRAMLQALAVEAFIIKSIEAGKPAAGGAFKVKA